jgi:hypothetical protein
MPAVVCAVEHWKPVVIDAHGERSRAGVEMSLDQRNVAKRCRKQNNGCRSMPGRRAFLISVIESNGVTERLRSLRGTALVVTPVWPFLRLMHDLPPAPMEPSFG